jgi:hypothetical protein
MDKLASGHDSGYPLGRVPNRGNMNAGILRMLQKPKPVSTPRRFSIYH